tara:strand:- start:491 stop:2185 length:1695 start_codon:yes stop_codon:yes gene_type:complete
MAKQDIIVDVDVTGLKELEALQDSMSGVAKASKDASKQLDKATKEIKQADRASGKASEAVEGVASMFSRMGGAGGAAGGALESLAVTMTGPLGLAIGGAVVATGGLLIGFKALTGAISATSSAVLQYIQNNKTLTAAAERATSAFDELVETFGAAITGGENFAEVIDFIAEQFGIATKIIKDNAGTIFEVSKEVVNSLLTVVKVGVGVITGMIQTVVLPFDIAITGIRKFRIAGLTIIQKMLKEIGPFLVRIGVMTQESLTDQINITKSTLAEIPRGNFPLITGLQEAADATIGKITQLQEKIRGLSMGALGVGTGRARGGGGQRGPKPPPADERVISGQDPLFMFEEDRSHVDLPLSVQSTGNLKTTMDNLEAVKELEEALARTAARTAESNAIFSELGENIGGALTGAFVDLASSVGQFMGAFAAGTATLSEFGDAVADMMGGLASTMGRFFIEAGAAFLAGGFVGQGIGMIAAGVALNALGGVLGGVGSGNRGSGAGAAASGAASTVAREVQRSLRGPADNRINQTIEVVIAGRSIEPEMVNVIDQVVRLGRSRSLARRGV